METSKRKVRENIYPGNIIQGKPELEITKREVREEICPGDIIQGNPILEAVLHKNPNNAKMFTNHQDIVNHCTYHCRETTKCTETCKKDIADIFRNYGKDVVEYIPQHISTN